MFCVAHGPGPEKEVGGISDVGSRCQVALARTVRVCYSPGMRRALCANIVLVIAVLGLGAVLRFGHLGLDVTSVARDGPAVDDTYYYFGIARNMLAGLGATHDGLHATAGFHPAWMAVVVGVSAVTGDDLYLPVALAMYLQVLLAIVTGLVLFRLAKLVSGKEGAMFALLGWSVMPPFVTESINGLETGLACLGLIIGFWAHLKWVVPTQGRLTPKRAVLVGAIYGGMILCRLDLGLPAAILGVHWIFMAMRRPTPSIRWSSLRSIALATTTGLLVVAPWFAFVHHQTGGWLPESGGATRNIALAYGTRPGKPDTVHVDLKSPTSEFYVAQVLATARETLTRPTLWPVTVITTGLRESGVLPWGIRGLALVGAGMTAAWIAWRLHRRRRDPAQGTPASRTVGPIVLLASLGYVTAYTLLVFGSWWFQRYYTPMMLLWLMYSAIPIQRGFDALQLHQGSANQARLAAALVGTLVLAFAFGGREAQSDVKNPTAPYWEMAEMADQLLPEGARLGAFQSGTLAYASRHTVVNLDGVVNHQAGAALREGRVMAYALEEGVDCILDWPHVLHDLLYLRSEPGDLARWKLVASGSMDLLCVQQPPAP